MKKPVFFMCLFLIIIFSLFSSCVIKKELPTEPVLVIDSPVSIDSSQGEYTDRIAITWAKVLGAEKYYIYRSTDSGGDFVRIKSTAINYYEDTDVDVGVNYYYKVKAFSEAAGLSPSSPVAMGYLDPDALSAPENLKATNGIFEDKVDITWDEVDGAELYYIYRATEAYQFTELDNTVNTSYSDTTAEAGTDYYYRVKAWRPSSPSYSGYSDPDLGYLKVLDALVSPGNVAASNGTYEDKINITWDEVTGAELYYIYRATEAYQFTELTNTVNTTCSDTTAVSGTDYYYRIKAWRNTSPNYSGYSDPDLGYLKVYDALDTPVNVHASNGTSETQIDITWDEVTGAELYYIYRATEAYQFTELTTTLTANYSDNTAVSGTDYYYRIKAWRNTSPNYSGYSDPDLGYLKVNDALDTPVNVHAGNGTSETQIDITWDEVTGAVLYYIYRATEAYQFTELTTTLTANHSDNTAVPGIDYYYRVKAWRPSSPNYSGVSDPDLGYLKILEALPTSTGVRATDGSSATTITIRWDAVAGAEDYYVY
ncbi:MAG: hypothetical protein PHV06_02300, partial [bacterium]|nr:hypothetical protein [bacterium]